MSWFVDASAIVAILGVEEEWELVADRMDRDGKRLWSAMSHWESVVALARRLNKSIDETRPIIADFGAFNGFELVSIGEREADIAIDAYRRFGKRSGHRAQLNMGDCFAYACARTNNARLLYKGDDFAQTDLA